MKGSIEKQATEKRENNILGSSIFYFLFPKRLSKNIMWSNDFFLENLALLVAICPCSLRRMYG
jgi:hypothetical protein